MNPSYNTYLLIFFCCYCCKSFYSSKQCLLTLSYKNFKNVTSWVLYFFSCSESTSPRQCIFILVSFKLKKSVLGALALKGSELSGSHPVCTPLYSSNITSILASITGKWTARAWCMFTFKQSQQVNLPMI